MLALRQLFQNIKAVVAKCSPVNRLSDDEDRETSLYPGNDRNMTALAFVRLYVLVCCGALGVRSYSLETRRNGPTPYIVAPNGP